MRYCGLCITDGFFGWVELRAGGAVLMGRGGGVNGIVGIVGIVCSRELGGRGGFFVRRGDFLCGLGGWGWGGSFMGGGEGQGGIVDCCHCGLWTRGLCLGRGAREVCSM